MLRKSAYIMLVLMMSASAIAKKGMPFEKSQADLKSLFTYPPDTSVVVKGKMGIKAGSSVVNMPTGMSRAYISINVDTTQPYTTLDAIDSLVINGQVEYPVKSANVYLDSTLLHDMLSVGVRSMDRVLPGAVPGSRLEGYKYGEWFSDDLSEYYSIFVPEETDLDSLRAELESLNIGEIDYIPVCKNWDNKPQPDEEILCQFADKVFQWHLQDSVGMRGVDMLPAWDYYCKHVLREVRIGIIDGGWGVDPAHHTDYRNNVAPLSRVEMLDPPQWHGMGVTGVLSATAGHYNNFQAAMKLVNPNSYVLGDGIVGIAPRTKVVLVEHYNFARYHEGLMYLIDTVQVDVISISWGVLYYDPPLISILDYAQSKGVVIVSSIGNFGVTLSPPFLSLPAIHSGTFAISGSNKNGEFWNEGTFGSNWGDHTLVAAPASLIMTTSNNITGKPPYDSLMYAEGHQPVSGTSYSSPIVAGLVVLLKATYPDANLPLETIADILSRSPKGDTIQWNDHIGWGLVNAPRAVAASSARHYCSDVPGDANGDCFVNGADYTHLVNHLIFDSLPPVNPCMLDFDHDCQITSSDLAALKMILKGTRPILAAAEALGSEECCIGSPTVLNSDTLPSLEVAQNYPNPFNPATTISFTLPSASDVTVNVFNILGQNIATLTDGHFEAGNHKIEWDAGKVASGIYFYRIRIDDSVQTGRMVLLK